MILERCRQIAQHGVVLGGQGNQVRGIGRHELILAPVQIIQADRHVQRRTDVQTKHQSVELAHGDIFQAAAHQLFASPENLRPDEAGHIVDVEPGPFGLHFGEFHFYRSAKAVLPRLEHRHVHTVGRAIGKLGALAGLEIKPVPFSFFGFGIVQDFLNGDIECLIAGVRSGKALEHGLNQFRFFLTYLCLDIDMGKHAPGDRIIQLERINDILERRLQQRLRC